MPLQSLLTDAASRFGSRIALTMEDRTLTYVELDAAANRVANFLIRIGVRPGDRVAFWMPKSLEAFVSIWGILKAGAAFVPVDPSAPGARFATIARDCGVSALIASSDFAGDLAEQLDSSSLRSIIYVGNGTIQGPNVHAWSEIDAESGDPPPIVIDDASLALVQYTSGSAGAPKGAAISHRALLAQANWTVPALGLVSDDRIPCYTPLSSAMSTFELFSAVIAGAAVFPVPPRIAPFPAAVAKSWSEQRISAVYVVASVLQMLLSRGNLGAIDLSALRLIMIGGEHIPAQRLHELMSTLPRTRVVLSYGRTEAKLRSLHEVKFPPEEIDTRTIGKTAADTRLLVLGEDEQPVADGELGELWIAGPGLMLGYYGLPELTAEVMRTLTLGPNDRVLACRTGDMVWRHANGRLELVGRADDQIKVRGYRVETGEIERVLCRHPCVQAAVVVGVPDLQLGNRLKAVAVLKPGSDADEQALLNHCTAELPVYMIPESIELRASLPLMSNGKVDRRSIRETQSR